MATTQESSEPEGWLVRTLTSDFCPGFNRYVYWLKEPIGWFVLAAAISLIIGRYFNPVGWTIGASLIAVMAIGVVWPWFAVRGVVGGLRPEQSEVHEEDDCRLVFTVRNRLPLPVWGLAVEGYLAHVGDEVRPTVGLSSIPPLCSAEYPISVRPGFRGRYPTQPPKLVCGFPFGIWTARRELQVVHPLTVWPKVYPIRGVCPFVGPASAEAGEGQRGGRSGDFVGVRPYRRGDSLKHLHWAHMARTDQWIISERGGPQNVELEVTLDPGRPPTWNGRAIGGPEARALAPANGGGPENGGGPANRGLPATIGLSEREGQAFRSSLTWRIRIVASILVATRNGPAPVRFRLGDRIVPAARGSRGTGQWLDALADIPADGEHRVGSDVSRGARGRGARGFAGEGERRACGRSRPRTDASGRGVVRLEVTGCEPDPWIVQVIVEDPRGGSRAGGVRRVVTVDCRRDPAGQLDALWQELGDVHHAA